jgi:hypothetical protein
LRIHRHETHRFIGEMRSALAALPSCVDAKEGRRPRLLSRRLDESAATPDPSQLACLWAAYMRHVKRLDEIVTRV